MSPTPIRIPRKCGTATTGYVYSNNSCVAQQSGQPLPGQKLRSTGSGNSVSATNYTYDVAGRLIGSSQITTSAGTYPFVYRYYNNDGLASVQYPSRRTLVNCYDDNGRPAWVSQARSVSDCKNNTGGTLSVYASVQSYMPPAGIQTMTLGNGLVETRS